MPPIRSSSIPATPARSTSPSMGRMFLYPAVPIRSRCWFSARAAWFRLHTLRLHTPRLETLRVHTPPVHTQRQANHDNSCLQRCPTLMRNTAENVVRIEAVDLRYGCAGRIVVTGMGKSGLIARKIAATLTSTGSPALFLHPAEALHGDLGMVVRGDVVLALSASGETGEILQLLATVKRLGVPLITMTCDAIYASNPTGTLSTLAQAADVALDCSVACEACSLGLAPTASTTTMLALGDALAVALSERRGFKEE